ncbi:RHS repeat-associated core domain-containing protein, partial [Pseudomonas sp. PAB10]|uniref:RHS repeat-associated core domain-containing protein n=1 Tax=Pseudomonas sp. PAB10 TaxID=3233047 RepID=UPI003F993F07
RYIYDGDGQRVRKVRSHQTNARTLISEVRYLPGVEIRTHSGTGEVLHVVSAAAGSNSVQVLHWVARQPDDIAPDQVRYSLGDHLKSSTLELDHQARLISQEWYYPFGGTAWWAGRSAIEAKYKTVRYSGKERDATGLYYYGFRYYAPWLQRWINPDPAGDIDGLNRFQMVNNNPMVFFDSDGLGRTPAGERTHIDESVQSSEPTYSYFDENLQARFDLQKESRKRLDFIDNNMLHEPVRKYGIRSTYGTDDFQNVFQRELWTFKSNFRNPNTSDFFANDIARYQYTLISKKEGFFGHLPSLIKRDTVINKTTLKKTKKLESGSEEMLRTFLEETPNGKSTQRILNDFGLKATKVEINYDKYNDHADYFIHVVPNPLHAHIVSDNEPAPLFSNTTSHPQRQRNGPLSCFPRLFRRTQRASHNQVPSRIPSN